VRHHRHRRTPAERRPSIFWSETGAESGALESRERSSRSHQRSGRAEHKTQQLCRQAYRALVGALAGECGDPVLQSLNVVGVAPAPDATRLLVDVQPGTGTERAALHEILERLDRVRGLLRHAVAVAIVRKRAPELVFRCLAPTPSEGGAS
jgi:ribosome-binding factor A